MILTELKQYLDSHGSASEAELAKQFGLSQDGVAAMLAVWIRKGVVSRTEDISQTGHVIRVRYAVNRPDQLSLSVTV
ncbi:FeoC-like transcriptional regulator [Vibrio sp.]|uniref:FeoC-like transcriptional regulator n=1 Tax=Vibrio sp. TaxID=678 RepID=UPI003D1408C1